jgi:hypothetical protein
MRIASLVDGVLPSLAYSTAFAFRVECANLLRFQRAAHSLYDFMKLDSFLSLHHLGLMRFGRRVFHDECWVA